MHPRTDCHRQVFAIKLKVVVTNGRSKGEGGRQRSEVVVIERRKGKSKVIVFGAPDFSLVDSKILQKKTFKTNQRIILKPILVRQLKNKEIQYKLIKHLLSKRSDKTPLHLIIEHED